MPQLPQRRAKLPPMAKQLFFVVAVSTSEVHQRELQPTIQPIALRRHCSGRGRSPRHEVRPRVQPGEEQGTSPQVTAYNAHQCSWQDAGHRPTISTCRCSIGVTVTSQRDTSRHQEMPLEGTLPGPCSQYRAGVPRSEPMRGLERLGTYSSCSWAPAEPWNWSHYPPSIPSFPSGSCQSPRSWGSGSSPSTRRQLRP